MCRGEMCAILNRATPNGTRMDKFKIASLRFTILLYKFGRFYSPMYYKFDIIDGSNFIRFENTWKYVKIAVTIDR